MGMVWIPDGYTVDASIEPREGLHGRIKFRYRPMIHEERTIANARLASAGRADVSKVVAEVVASRIESWDVQDDKGHTVDVTAANVARIQPELVERLWGIVLGQQTADTLHEPRRANAEVDAGYQALLEKGQRAAEREKADVGN